MNCGHRYACGGGCREDSMGDKGNIHEPSNVHCALKEMWIKGAIKVIAGLPKQTLATFCKEPGDPRQNSQRNRKSYSYIPPSQLPRDEQGIVKNEWVENIPKVALVKEGVAEVADLPTSDSPLDYHIVDNAFNPAGPVVIDRTIAETILR